MVRLNNIENKDCIEYLKTIPDNYVDLVVIDPPYNVSLNKNIKLKTGVIKKNFGDWDKGFNPKEVLDNIKRVLKPNGHIYVFCATKQIPQYMLEFLRYWDFKNLLVWHKRNSMPRIHKNNYVFSNEYILYAINEKNKIKLNYKKHSEMMNTIITTTLQGRERLKNSDGKTLHPTQKPLSVIKHFIEVSSNEGDVVLDCFMGTGTTAVACKELNRNFIGCEKDEIYWKESKKRLNQLDK